jgi:hypothetical protein
MNRRSSASIAIALGTAASLLAAGSSHALSVSSATLSDLRISMVDLDPGDGNAPFVMLAPDDRSVVDAYVYSPGANGNWSNEGGSAFGSVSAVGDLQGTGGDASITGDPFAVGGATFATRAHARPDDFGGGGLAGISSGTYSNLAFLTLSPHTALTFSGHALVSWQASAVQASAYGSVDMWMIENLSTLEIIQQDHFLAGYYGAPPPVSLGGVAEDDLSMSYTNASDANVVLAFEIFVESNASETDLPPVSTVPEPDNAALMLAGVFAVTLSAWRRRRFGGRRASGSALAASRPS